MSLEENCRIVKDKIDAACYRSNRNTNDITIIAVTKYVDTKKIIDIMNIGYKHIGENRVQDAIEKYQQLQGKGTWHLIGQLQTNKVKNVIGKFKYLHSLDRLNLAGEINKRALEKDYTVNCFIQVNISEEKTKSGIEPNKIFDFAYKLKDYKNINIVGLMTMAPLTENMDFVRPIFKKLKELQESLNEKGIFEYPIKELSMGMSNDFEVAIEEGATYIRLGSILFNK